VWAEEVRILEGGELFLGTSPRPPHCGPGHASDPKVSAAVIRGAVVLLWPAVPPLRLRY